ncbi:IS66-like element accessory protein TnpA [Enterobacter bugandensis]
MVRSRSHITRATRTASLPREKPAIRTCSRYRNTRICRRPNFFTEFKLHLVELSMQSYANVARLAQEHGINDNLLFNWRHQYKQGKLNCPDNQPVELLPVSIVPPSVASAPLTAPLPPDVLCCEVALPGGTVKLHGAVSQALLRVLLSELKGGVR